MKNSEQTFRPKLRLKFKLLGENGRQFVDERGDRTILYYCTMQTTMFRRNRNSTSACLSNRRDRLYVYNTVIRGNANFRFITPWWKFRFKYNTLTAVFSIRYYFAYNFKGFFRTFIVYARKNDFLSRDEFNVYWSVGHVMQVDTKNNSVNCSKHTIPWIPLYISL